MDGGGWVVDGSRVVKGWAVVDGAGRGLVSVDGRPAVVSFCPFLYPFNLQRKKNGL